jgi:hypothetical protein
MLVLINCFLFLFLICVYMDIILLHSCVKYIYVVMFNINMSQNTQLVVTSDHHLLRHLQMLFIYILHLHGPSLTARRHNTLVRQSYLAPTVYYLLLIFPTSKGWKPESSLKVPVRRYSDFLLPSGKHLAVRIGDTCR